MRSFVKFAGIFKKYFYNSFFFKSDFSYKCTYLVNLVSPKLERTKVVQYMNIIVMFPQRATLESRVLN